MAGIQIINATTTPGDVITMGFAVRFQTSLPTGDTPLVSFYSQDQGEQVGIRYESTDSKLYLYNVGLATNILSVNKVLSANTWYLVLVEVNTTTNTWSCKMTVANSDGSGQVEGTGSQTVGATADLDTVYIGTDGVTNGAGIFNLDDAWISYTSGDYALAKQLKTWIVEAHFVNADGTHTVGNGHITGGTSGTVNTASTNVYTNINQSYIFDNTGQTKYLQFTAADSGYVECLFSDITNPGYAPHGVWAATAAQAFTGTGNQQIVLQVGTPGNFTTLKAAADDPGNSRRYYPLMNNFFSTVAFKPITPPAGGWTRTNVNDIRFRAGQAAAASPQEYVWGVCLNVLLLPGDVQVTDSASGSDSAVVTSASLKVASDSGSASDSSAKTTSIFPAFVAAGQIDANSDGVRKFDYCQNGVWWSIRMPDGVSIRLYRSTDQGATWTPQAGDINIAGALGHDNLTGAAMFIDKDDYLHIAATTYVTAVGVYFSYWRFTPNGARTSYGSQVIIDYFFVGDYGGIDNPDIIAYKAIGGGWDIWACCALRASGFWYLYVIQFRLDSAGNYFDANGYNDIGYSLNPFYGKLDFRHTASDPKAVQAGTPSVYVVQFNGSWQLAPFLTKYRYSGGSWIQEGYVNLDPTSQASGLGWAAYDGTRIVIGFNRTPGQVRETLPRIIERDEANTTTTTHNPSNPGDGAIEELAFNTDSAGNISYYVVGGGTNRVLRSVYNRGSGSWSGWTPVSGPTATSLGALKALSGIAPPAFDPIIYFTDAVYFRNFGAVGLDVIDTGSASDQSVLDTHQLQVFDGGFSQDASSNANVLATRADSATGTDAVASVNAAFARTDSAVASDTSSAPNLMFLADIAGATDTAVVYMQLFIAVSDTGVGSDLGSQGLYVNVTDSGAGSETSAAGVLKPVTDSGVASDARTLLVVYFATETGTAVDTVVSVGVPPRTVTDSAVGIDTVFAAPIVPVTVSTRFGMFGFATQSQYGVEASPATYAMPLGMPEGSGVPAPVVAWAEHFPAKGSVGLQEVRRELVPWAGDFTVPAFTRPLPSLLRGLLGSESRVGTAHTQVPATDDVWFTFFSLRPGTSSEGYRDGLIEGLRFDFVSGEPVQLGIQAQGREPYYMPGPFNSMETADIRSGWLTYVGADVRLDWNTQTPTTRWECEGGSLSIRRPAFVQGNYRDMKPVAVTRGNLEIELQVELVHREISHYRYSAYGGLATTPQLGTAYGSADITFFEPMNTNRYARFVIPAIAWEVDAPQPLAHPEEGNITLQAVGHAIVPAVIGRTGSVISTVTDNGLVSVL
jgi:hypothetical protein